jgi:hypothetical protein
MDLSRRTDIDDPESLKPAAGKGVQYERKNENGFGVL